MHEEQQYLDLVREVLEKGVLREDRTGTGTLSLFGRSMRFDLSGGWIPLFTTKRVFWRGVVEELLWFISGSTNANLLKEKGVGIWNDNTSRKYLDSVGLSHYAEGDAGSNYGFQWRHFGAEYKGMHHDYTGQGVDQLAQLIHTIKTKPTDRRMILSAWNPVDLKKAALPPCHLLAQFYVAEGRLSCQMYQRSCDLGLGVPFNVASYSLLTCMIAHVCGLQPGEFIHVLGDAHVYTTHIDALKQQLVRRPSEFPFLSIKDSAPKDTIDGFCFEDFELTGYVPQPPIPMPMAV